MKAVYEATYSIPELGVQPGDVVVVEPAHPDVPLLIVKEYDRNRLPAILDHLDHFNLLTFDAPPSTHPAADAIRRWLSAPDRQTRSSGRLRLVR